MKTMNSELRKEVAWLEKIVQKANKRLQTAPEGNLRISKKPEKAGRDRVLSKKCANR